MRRLQVGGCTTNAVVLPTHLGSENAPEILTHSRLYLEDRLVGRRAQVYPAVVQSGVRGHCRHLCRAQDKQSGNNHEGKS